MYLLICFGTVDQVRFNPLKPEDYCLSFSMPTWSLNYGQKLQEALSCFIHLYSQPGKYILDAFASTHSASLAAALAGHNAIAVKKDTKQWHYTSTNLPNQYQRATSSHPSTSQQPTATSPSSQLPQDSPPTSPKPLQVSHHVLDMDLPSTSLCLTCSKSIIKTTEEIVQCDAPTCMQTIHSECSISLPDGGRVCSQQCTINLTSTSSTPLL
ncbi:uncharacterized protein ACA1_274990 [Acanthamoeba castellanii str. Neff]|uniref:Uncharacterized protein n=1 Tax=Acanthamoeba castellanii (strain ATCC 30010 / Neff) TaxID=1257118 RepID=L8GFP5_ACACF|nr:uncharacterized protein ACA1_274990 [Acanthamoeba castellanii str. Neff]ELR11910.1 hypothetical protein ACA1_274990 [Acanthamoeba castellanii str. Neff]